VQAMNVLKGLPVQKSPEIKAPEATPAVETKPSEKAPAEIKK